MSDRQRGVSPGSYFARYRQKLEPMIGRDAAGVAAAYYKWTVGGIGCALLGIALAVLAHPGTAIAGLLAVLAAFIAMAGCGVRSVALSARGGKLAADHLAEQFGHPVRNHGLKVSYRWWQEFVAGEGTTRRDEMWRPRK